MARKGGVPGDNFGSGDQIQSCRGQGRHMQRLANVAGAIRTAGVLVEEGSSGRKVKQCGTRQQSHRAAQVLSPENQSMDFHQPTLTLALGMPI